MKPRPAIPEYQPRYHTFITKTEETDEPNDGGPTVRTIAAAVRIEVRQGVLNPRKPARRLLCFRTQTVAVSLAKNKVSISRPYGANQVNAKQDTSSSPAAPEMSLAPVEGRVVKVGGGYVQSAPGAFIRRIQRRKNGYQNAAPQHRMSFSRWRISQATCWYPSEQWKY
jgi:hypothetical protein